MAEFGILEMWWSGEPLGMMSKLKCVGKKEPGQSCTGEGPFPEETAVVRALRYPPPRLKRQTSLCGLDSVSRCT